MSPRTRMSNELIVSLTKATDNRLTKWDDEAVEVIEHYSAKIEWVFYCVGHSQIDPLCLRKKNIKHATTDFSAFGDGSIVPFACCILQGPPVDTTWISQAEIEEKLKATKLENEKQLVRGGTNTRLCVSKDWAQWVFYSVLTKMPEVIDEILELCKQNNVKHCPVDVSELPKTLGFDEKLLEKPPVAYCILKPEVEDYKVTSALIRQTMELYSTSTEEKEKIRVPKTELRSYLEQMKNEKRLYVLSSASLWFRCVNSCKRNELVILANPEGLTLSSDDSKLQEMAREIYKEQIIVCDAQLIEEMVGMPAVGCVVVKDILGENKLKMQKKDGFGPVESFPTKKKTKKTKYSKNDMKSIKLSPLSKDSTLSFAVLKVIRTLQLERCHSD